LKRVVFAAALGLALASAGCGELPDPTTVKDLRVLAVKCEPAGFLVDLDNPGGAMQADLTAQITALVADPLAPGGMITISSAVGCPDYIDTITAATGQGSKVCPPASATSQIPPPVGPLLTTATIVPTDMPVPFPPAITANPTTVFNDYEYHPTVSFGLTPEQVGAFFSPTPTGIPALDLTIAYNRDFGLPAIVNLSFDINGEHAEALKRVVYWPRLDPAQPVNRNPTLDGVWMFRRRNPNTGDPEDMISPADPSPTFSISAGDKLYVLPLVSDNTIDAPYLLRVKNTQTLQVETQSIARELIRFQFFANAGSFSPAEQQSEPLPGVTGALHIDSEYVLPKPEDRPADGKVTIWIVTHDERAGVDWTSRSITVLP
jgi:hypothetical protein